MNGTDQSECLHQSTEGGIGSTIHYREHLFDYRAAIKQVVRERKRRIGVADLPPFCSVAVELEREQIETVAILHSV